MLSRIWAQIKIQHDPLERALGKVPSIGSDTPRLAQRHLHIPPGGLARLFSFLHAKDSSLAVDCHREDSSSICRL